MDDGAKTDWTALLASEPTMQGSTTNHVAALAARVAPCTLIIWRSVDKYHACCPCFTCPQSPTVLGSPSIYHVRRSPR